MAFDGPDDARQGRADIYRRDRTEGQPRSVYLGVEKNGMIARLETWFGDLGVPILALGGYLSPTYADQVQRDTAHDGRKAVPLYAGDFDASGEDIDRDFVARSGCFDELVRVTFSTGRSRCMDCRCSSARRPTAARPGRREARRAGPG